MLLNSVRSGELEDDPLAGPQDSVYARRSPRYSAFIGCTSADSGLVPKVVYEQLHVKPYDFQSNLQIPHPIIGEYMRLPLHAPYGTCVSRGWLGVPRDQAKVHNCRISEHLR
jgi:hypothetical protein